MSTTSLSSLDLAQFCARYLAAWNSHDVAAIADLVTDDVVYEDPALPEPARGAVALKDFMRQVWVAFPDLRFDEGDDPHLSVAGDRVAWAWRMCGINTGPIDPPGFAPTGRAIEIEGVDLWTMRDGRIARLRVFYDVNALAVQLGLTPAAGSRMERAAVALQRLQARVATRRPGS